MRVRAQECLDKMYGKGSCFRDGQFEAIESVVSGNKTLVVERTGWGKSTVYFIATKLLREKGFGVTILVSPLLSLMRNQIESARPLGIVAETINSTNQEEWDEISEKLESNEIDILLISPERLGNSKFMTEFLSVIDNGIGMLVVDEAHCISDWGHDFRPDYQRIVNIINMIPQGVPVLTTTATANDRVVEDIKKQLGEVVILRGPLLRESLKLQVIRLASQAERMAWLYEHISSIEGSGIIYCLTTADCNRVAGWLKDNGINALEYHSKLSIDKEENKRFKIDRENKLMNNDVKVLVSTIALGMGYDKPDLSFVIHFQRPGSVVSYYQQIGRAGRSLEEAIVVLLTGDEDDEIHDYFINNAFPSLFEMESVVEEIEKSYNGISTNQILSSTNISVGRLTKCLKKLMVDEVIIKDGSKYVRTPKHWDKQEEKMEAITNVRLRELEDMRSFTKLDSCYMKFIADKLDDPYSEECGKCSNCINAEIISSTLSQETIARAIKYLKSGQLVIKPRKQWPAGIIAETRKKIPENQRNEEGLVLSIYGDAGWGGNVRNGKYVDEHFSDELVEASAEVIREWEAIETIEWITYIPSLRRPELVKSFAERLAQELELPIRMALVKPAESPEQKSFENSYHQCKNAYESFDLTNNIENGPVLLIDDMYDSGWTFTACGSLLRREGVEAVYPFALASTSKIGGE